MARPRGGAFVLSWGDGDAADLALALAREALNRDDLTLGRLCPHCGSATHGRPLVLDAVGRGVPDAHVSLGRCGAFGVAAFSADPVGIDVQGFEDADASLASVVLHPRERVRDAAGLTRRWVLKEALLKALGTGLATDPRQIRLGGVRAPRVVSGPGRGARLTFRELPGPGPEGPERYAVAVAVLPGSGRPGR
jgi:4'-phosphopantetheinyl transferase